MGFSLDFLQIQDPNDEEEKSSSTSGLDFSSITVDEVKPFGFWRTLGNAVQYGGEVLGEAMFKGTLGGRHLGQVMSTQAQALPKIASNAKESIVDFFNVRQDWEQAKSIADKVSDVGFFDVVKGVPSSIPQMGAAIVNDLVSPIEAITATENIGGVPVPIEDPLQQAMKIQQGGAMIISTAVGVGAHKLLKPALKGEVALEHLSRHPIGNLARSVGADAITAASAGATFTGIKELGQEDQFGKVLETVLAVAPVGGIFGVFSARGRNRAALNERARLISEETPSSISEMAAANGLKLDANSRPVDVLANVSALATSDDLAEAFIMSGMNKEMGVIVPDLSPNAKAKLMVKDKVVPGQVVESETGATLFLPPGAKLVPHYRETFKKSGFLPNQLVEGSTGTKYIIKRIDKDGFTLKVEDLNGQQHTFAVEEAAAKFRLADNQVNPKAIETLTTEKYFNELYNKFKANPLFEGEPFDAQITKFMKENGLVDSIDKVILSNQFYKRMQDDLLQLVDSETKDVFTKINNKLGETNSKMAEDLGVDLYRQANSNELYIKRAGPGSYEIRSLATGEVVERVTNFRDAQKAINKIGQVKAPDLDGGAGGSSIPPAVFGTSSNMQAPYSGPVAPYSGLDQVNIRFAKHIPVIRGLAESIDKHFGTKTFTKIYERLQIAQNMERAYLLSKLKLSNDLKNNAVKLMQKYKFDVEMDKMARDLREALSPDDIINGAFGRKLTPVETQAAQGLAQLDLDQVFKFMRDLQRMAGNADPGSPKYDNALKRIMLDYDPQVVSQGVMLRSMGEQSTPYILRLADAIKNNTISRKDLKQSWIRAGYEPKKIAQIEEVVTAFDKFFDNLDKDTGRNGLNRTGFSSHARVESATKFNPYINKQADKNFASEMWEQMGNVDGGINELATQTIFAISKSEPIIPLKSVDFFNDAKALDPDLPELLSVRDVHRMVHKSIIDESSKLPKKESEAVGGIMKYYYEQAKGVKELDKALSDAVEVTAKSLIPHSETIAATWLTATQAFIPIYAVRDMLSGWGNVFMRLGPKKFHQWLKTGLTKEEALILNKEGKLPITTSLDMLMPNEDIMFAFRHEPGGYARWIKRQASNAMDWTGQHYVYTHQAGSMYKFTMKEASEGFNKIIRGEATKEQVFKDLKIHRMGGGFTQQIDQMLIAGNSQEAAQLLAKERIRTMIGAYGLHNNPVAWQGNFGRLLGQAGSWSSNQLQTVGAMTRGLMTPGMRLEAAGELFRFAAFNAALKTAGWATGFDLLSWMNIPYFQIGGPAIQVARDVLNASQQIASENENLAARGWATVKRNLPISWSMTDAYEPYDMRVRLNQVYLPFGRAAQGFIEGYQWLQQDDPFNAIGRAGGLYPKEPLY